MPSTSTATFIDQQDNNNNNYLFYIQSHIHYSSIESRGGKIQYNLYTYKFNIYLTLKKIKIMLK